GHDSLVLAGRWHWTRASGSVSRLGHAKDALRSLQRSTLGAPELHALADAMLVESAGTMCTGGVGRVVARPQRGRSTVRSPPAPVRAISIAPDPCLPGLRETTRDGRCVPARAAPARRGRLVVRGPNAARGASIFLRHDAAVRRYPDAQVQLTDRLTSGVRAALAKAGLPEPEECAWEVPRQAEHGDYATNVPMVLARAARRAPRQIADLVVEDFPPMPEV